MRVQVCIPHYFREHADPGDNPNGYGSLRQGGLLARSIALGRCISSLLDLQRRPETCLLNISNRNIEHYNNSEEPLEISICICTDGIHTLKDVLDIYRNEIEVITLKPSSSSDLPLECRDHLINNYTEFDLLCYIEDDIIISDRLFFDKILWFHEKTNHKLCLMPHRYECVNKENMEKLIIDGPNFTGPNVISQQRVAYGKFQETDHVWFDMANNPHSGSFTISQEQARKLRTRPQPRVGFLGPLETAATLTVLIRFPVLKPCQECWSFLRVEHGAPSFLYTINNLPHLSIDSP